MFEVSYGRPVHLSRFALSELAEVQPVAFEHFAVKPASNLEDIFFISAGRRPARRAMIASDDAGNPVATLTYAEVAARAWRLARHIRRLGVMPGDRVAMRLPRGAEAIVAEIAILASGAASSRSTLPHRLTASPTLSLMSAQSCSWQSPTIPRTRQTSLGC